MAMLSGQIAEMATGEGKTLSGAIAAAGYALSGRSVHVVAVNDYLAQRDAEWMRPVYDLMGVTVGWISQSSTPAERRRAYAAEVTYAPVSEIGFDVLRDRLAVRRDDMVTARPGRGAGRRGGLGAHRRGAGAAGAGRRGRGGERGPCRWPRSSAGWTPGRTTRSTRTPATCTLTEAGAKAVEQALGDIDLYTDEHLATLTRLNVALHAHALLQRDVDYIVTGEKVRLVSESRGRVAWLQRLPDGLHAAVEAKEGLSATDTGEILDSITIESLIRSYPTVCGMTGTAVAVGEQLREFYGVEVAVIPPNVPCVREDEPDRLYATLEAKETAIVGRGRRRRTRPAGRCSSGRWTSPSPSGWRPGWSARACPAWC